MKRAYLAKSFHLDYDSKSLTMTSSQQISQIPRPKSNMLNQCNNSSLDNIRTSKNKQIKNTSADNLLLYSCVDKNSKIVDIQFSTQVKYNSNIVKRPISQNWQKKTIVENIDVKRMLALKASSLNKYSSGDSSIIVKPLNSLQKLGKI
ncbi:Hypothetical_protein [Hexamita inflata]|uniref:Hypothetical_protein n=1 Tax=Hexamita inflata TaxID=28002 RepID=A0AA86NFW9_9EUKA|nr:Hypothetical protein HINF_LOCUS6176 [Hexamita inflata]